MFSLLFLLGFMVTSISTVEAMSMGMRMKERPEREDPQKKREQIKRERKKGVEIVKEARQIQQDIIAIRDDQQPSDSINSALFFAVDIEDNAFLKELLDMDLDPNYRSPYGRPLEKAQRMSTIKLLLDHGADPKQCDISPLASSLMYYLGREDILKQRVESYDNYAARRKKEVLRRANKAFPTMVWLLKEDVDVNQTYNHLTPVQTIITLCEMHHGFLPDIAQEFLKMLVWHGAHVEGFGSFRSGNSFEMRILLPRAAQERAKYNSTVSFLFCASDESSLAAQLPQELKGIIGKLAKQGFEFQLIEEKKEKPPVAEQRVIAMDDSPSQTGTERTGPVDAPASSTSTIASTEVAAPSASCPERSVVSSREDASVPSTPWYSALFSRYTSPLFSNRLHYQKVTTACLGATAIYFGYWLWKEQNELKKKCEAYQDEY